MSWPLRDDLGQTCPASVRVVGLPSWGSNNPGPAVTRQGRRLERSLQNDASPDEGPVRPNCGRHVRRCVDDEALSTVPVTPISLAKAGRVWPAIPSVVDALQREQSDEELVSVSCVHRSMHGETRSKERSKHGETRGKERRKHGETCGKERSRHSSSTVGIAAPSTRSHAGPHRQ